jgi:hypothetical protein
MALQPSRWKPPPEARAILLWLLATRAALLLVGVLSRLTPQPHWPKRRVWMYSEHLWLDLWGVWDSGVYLHIARSGYPDPSQPLPQPIYNHFPLYPLLMRLLGAGLGDLYLAGLLISNAALIGACFVLYRLARLDADERTALASVRFLLLMPVAFVLSGVFTEALFLLLLLSCFYFARQQRWLLAGVCGFFLMLTRLIGLAALPCLLYEYLRARRFRLREVRVDVLALLLLPAGLGLYCLYLDWLCGDPLAILHAQVTRTGGLKNPLAVLLWEEGIKDFYDEFCRWYAVVHLVLLSLFARKLGFSYWLFGMLALLVPILGGAVEGVPRYTLVVFPLPLLLARLLRDQAADQAATIGLALFQGFLMVYWSHGSHLVI